MLSVVETNQMEEFVESLCCFLIGPSGEQIQELILDNNNIGDDGLIKITNMLQKRQKLFTKNLKEQEYLEVIFDSLMNNYSLQNLSIRENNLNLNGWKLLIKLLQKNVILQCIQINFDEYQINQLKKLLAKNEFLSLSQFFNFELNID
ncbi:hypothetical protein PPERSA_05506 [Pseudocohnilembus persalinus]|uniref:Uncharacterized protein n=1 Tax=Pseudocohnilembus persalinus TaxID=266149 RepID=A0A0V0QCR6_PSEPJ|nr:hypothetical protein PPERSA_05506 [Pseudocohnilembus persalinus]|eukprot:KRX00004.1 hypothetical protein PPERSA_05506 [Pseudocohnilembus persalinus]